jgi:hypothetical protein
MSRRVRILANDPRAVPRNLPFPNEVQLPTDGEDKSDEKPPKLPTTAFAPDLDLDPWLERHAAAEEVVLQVRDITYLHDPGLARVVVRGLDRGQEMTIDLDLDIDLP